jgi:predicted ATPase/DNA-binding SARP family transcriptional activator/DNA-binding CsgD family transcriptional regulator
MTRNQASSYQGRLSGSEGRTHRDVRLRLLGDFVVSMGDRTISEDDWRLRKAASVIKLLALAPGHRLHREQIMDALWPDLGRSAASNNLRRTLHAARQVLEPAPATSGRYLVRKGEHLILCPAERIWVDVEAFEDAASAARRNREPAAYRAAVDLYAGDLLPGDRYEDWAEERRRQLGQTFLSLLVELARLHEARGEYSAAVEVLGRAVTEYPTREEAHVALMRAHALSGNVDEALAQYDRLEGTLSQDLDAQPRVSSRLLRDEIASGRFPPRETKSPTRDSRQATEFTDSPRHNLPAPRTSFVGREREMREIKRELSMTRLLTLTGAGGSGKTRLALEVARDLVGAYQDGVWLVELAPLSDSTLVPQAVATALAVQEQAGQPFTETLVEILRSKDMLLLLDNCEHLVGAAASLVDALLDACPDLKVLATSREALGVAGEARWTVPALSTPGLLRTPTVGELEIYESVRLFAERVRHRESSFALTATNARPVAEICERLGGLPLAVALAAARVGTLGVSEVSGRLGDSLGLLTAGGRTAAPRQRTLRGTLDWSHDLLSEDEKRLFRRLSAFAGGWTIEAAEIVCSGDGTDERDVLDLLSGLADKSLVVVRATGDGAVRYRFLEPVHHYARERLEASGEGEGIALRHAAFYLALAEEAEPRLRGPNQAAWSQRLYEELDNFRTALARSPDYGETETCLRLASALLFFWTWRGSHQEGYRWLQWALAKDDVVSRSIRAKALNSLADITIMLGYYEKSQALLQESLALYRADGDVSGIAACLCDLGWLAAFRGEFRRAKDLLEESLVRARDSGDTIRTAFVLNRLAGVASANLDHETAERLLQESLTLYREVGDSKSVAMDLGMLAYLALRQGDHEKAVRQTEEAMGRIREAGLSMDAYYPTVLALAVMSQGDLARAKELTADALMLGRKSGNKLHTIQAVEMAAMLATARQDFATAASLWGAADAQREALGAPLDADDKALYEPHLASGRSELGTGSWTAAWKVGRTMTLDEAVDRVLSEKKASPSAHSSPTSERVNDPLAVLSRREREVASLLARGLSNAQIASELHISERTVENHVASILKKMGLRSRDQVSHHLGDL